MKMLTFGCDKIMRADSAERPLSDHDLDNLIRRDQPKAKDKDGKSSAAASSPGSRKPSPGRKSPRGKDAAAAAAEAAAGGGGEDGAPLLESGKSNAADFKTELPPMMTQMLQGKEFKKGSNVGDIGKQWALQAGKRERKSTTVKVGGQAVLVQNMYEMGGHISVFAQEQQGKSMGFGESKRKLQIPGRDYQNENHCLQCWGTDVDLAGEHCDLILCERCPAAYHATCLGYENTEAMLANMPPMGWSCPQHSCNDCGRKSAAAGGLLFRW